jgi:hypothetical protein
MAYQPLFTRSDIQTLSPTLTIDTVRCTTRTSPTGIILDYQIPTTLFDIDQGAGRLNVLSQAVEDLISSGFASGGYGVQTIDPSTNLLAEAVSFTVSYTPPGGLGIPLTVNEEIPVDAILAPAELGGFFVGVSALDRLEAAYTNLQHLAGQ